METALAKGLLLPPIFGYRVPNSGFTGPGAGYKWRVYDTGTTDLSSIFSDNALTSAATNPLVANADGEFAATFVDDGEYDVALLTDTDTVIQSIANVRVMIPHRHICFNITNGPATGDILTFEATFAFSLLANLSGSRAHCDTAPADGAYAMTIHKNGGAAINNLSIAQGANDSTVGTTNSETSFAIGDTLTVVMPTADSALADLGVSLKVRVD